MFEVDAEDGLRSHGRNMIECSKHHFAFLIGTRIPPVSPFKGETHPHPIAHSIQKKSRAKQI